MDVVGISHLSIKIKAPGWGIKGDVVGTWDKVLVVEAP